MEYQPVALVDDRERRELLERRLRGYPLGAIAGAGLGRRERRRRAEGQDAEELVEVAAQLLDLGVAAADDRLELGDSLVLGAQQLLEFPQGAHGRGLVVRRTTCGNGGDGGRADAAAAVAGVDGDGDDVGGGSAVSRRQLRRGGVVLRRREAQRVEAHAHRHAGVADWHSVFGTLVHSTLVLSARERERERTRSDATGTRRGRRRSTLLSREFA